MPSTGVPSGPDSNLPEGAQPSHASFPRFSVWAGVTVIAYPDAAILKRALEPHHSSFVYSPVEGMHETIVATRIFSDLGRTEGPIKEVARSSETVAMRLLAGQPLWNITFNCGSEPHYVLVKGLADTQKLQAQLRTSPINLRGLFDFDLKQMLSESLPVVIDASGVATFHPYYRDMADSMRTARDPFVIVISDSPQLTRELSGIPSIRVVTTLAQALLLVTEAA
jgi:hypothetical protein